MKPRSFVAVCAAALGLLVAAGIPVPALAGPSQQNCLAVSPPCYAPQQFRTAYDIQPLLDRGIDGHGETVSMIAPFPGPTSAPPQITDIRQDLAIFDGLFNLPPAHISVVTSLAGAGSRFEASLEEVYDAEIVHAVAPAAALRVVLMPSNVLDSAANATADMVAALRLLVRNTDVVSFSWGLGEHRFSRAQLAEMEGLLRGAAARHVTVVASSGDSGAVGDVFWPGAAIREVNFPASDPFVLGTGGTELTADPQTGAYIGETAWNQAPKPGGNSGASGGGFSGIIARPAYQDGVPGNEATRGVPDVAGDAFGRGGMALAVDAGGGTYLLNSASGTSASAPLWGGLVALADQLAGHDLGFVNPALYRIARSALYDQAFHDVTTGNNTVVVNGATYGGYQAASGWDPVTGLGSPNAAILVPLLTAR